MPAPRSRLTRRRFPRWAWGTVVCALTTCASATENSPDGNPQAFEWSAPTRLFDADLRLAAGTALHAVGVTGGALVHRSSADEGATWSVASSAPNGRTCTS